MIKSWGDGIGEGKAGDNRLKGQGLGTEAIKRDRGNREREREITIGIRVGRQGRDRQRDGK